MADKVALPSLSLPKQKTHWTVGVVIAAGVLFVMLGAALYMVLRNRQAESNAFARHESDRLEAIKTEKAKIEAEKANAEAQKAAAEAETKKKEAETSALTAQRKFAVAASEEKDKGGNNKKMGGKKGGSKVANGKAAPSAPGAPAAAAPAAPPPAPKQSKASKDIDYLLKSFK